MRRRPLLTTVTLTAALGLAGCAATPAPAPTTAAVETTAVDTSGWAKQAEAVYTAYQIESDKSLAAGGASIEAEQPLLSPAEYVAEQSTTGKFRATGRRQVGTTSIRNFTVQAVSASTRSLSAYVCLDLSKSRIVDRTGKVVVLANRPISATLLVAFDFSVSPPVIKQSDAWPGTSVC